MTFSAHYAEQHFAELVKAASSGEDVEIDVKDQLTLKLVVSARKPSTQRAGCRILGAGRGEMRVPSEEEWRAYKEEMTRMMNDAPPMTSGEI